MSAVVSIQYTNWKGRLKTYRIVPVGLHYKATQWHPDAEWLLQAVVIEGDGTTKSRDFALADIYSWDALDDGQLTAALDEERKP